MHRLVVLLDSGAITVHTKGIQIDIEKFAEFAIAHKNLFRSGVFNLDVIGSASKSYDNWMTLRRLGLDTIPVYHMGDGAEYLTKYMDNSEYISLGGMTRTNVGTRLYELDYVWNNYILDAGGRSRVRVHGLGLTDEVCLLRYPWFSVDSKGTIARAAYGSVMIPRRMGSYSSLNDILVSTQSRVHTAGSISSIYSMPERSRRQLKEMFAELGFCIADSISGVKYRAHVMPRKKGDRIWSEGLGIIDHVPLEDDVVPEDNGTDVDPATGFRNLSTSWRARFGLNLLMMDRFVEHWRAQGKTRRIYHVLGTTNLVRNFSRESTSKPVSRALVSFARMPQLQLIQSIVDGNQAGEAGGSYQNHPTRRVAAGAIRAV